MLAELGTIEIYEIIPTPLSTVSSQREQTCLGLNLC